MEKYILLDRPEEAAALLGVLNRNARQVDAAFGVQTEQSPQGLRIEGEELPLQQAEAVWRSLLESFRQEGAVSERQLGMLLANAQENGSTDLGAAVGDVLCISAKGRPVRARTKGQARYAKAIADSDLTFAIGPAGTGKTYLAVAMAVKAMREHRISRIILTRPAVEAGEKLGFLPGDLQNKVDPYMRPLYDALYELLGTEQFARLMERGAIEISPLAYMRGRTLDDAFIILDEAQNTSPEQMKMFLTRIGFHSKAVVTGDITQIDLPPDRRSGLADAKRILGRLDELAFIELNKEDVVRNPLIQKIIAAYEKFEKNRFEKESRALHSSRREVRKR